MPTRSRLAHRKEQRKEYAAERQKHRNTLSPQEQLNKLDLMGFAAVKERARLKAKIEAAEMQDLEALLRKESKKTKENSSKRK